MIDAARKAELLAVALAPLKRPGVGSAGAGRRDDGVPRTEVERTPSATDARDASLAGVQEGMEDTETPQCARVKHRGES